MAAPITNTAMPEISAAAPASTSVLAIYPTHTAAEDAIRSLQRQGFDMRKLSIVGKDYYTDEDVIGYYNTGDRVRFWSKWGGFWGGLAGILFGSAFLLVPVVGHVVVLGPLVSWIVNGITGAAVVGGVSALGAALYSIGIPKDSIVRYETALRADKFLLIAHGSGDEMRQAEEILSATGAEEIELHEPLRDDAAAEASRAGGVEASP